MKPKHKLKGMLLCMVVTCSLFFTSIPVHAESVGSLEKTLDLVLVKLGVVCNENGLNTIANNLYDTAIGNVQDFEEYCTTNELDPTASTSYDSWKETREYQDHLLDMVMENKYRIATEEGSEVTLDFTKDDMNDAIHGGDGVERGKEYTIDEDTVNQMHTTFQNWWSENSQYYIYRVPSFSEIPVSYFSNQNVYDVAKQFVALHTDKDFVYIAFGTGNSLSARTPICGAQYYVNDTSYTPSDSSFTIRQAVSWVQTYFDSWYNEGSTSTTTIDCDYLIENYENLTLDNFTQVVESYSCVLVSSHDSYNHNFIVSNVAKNIKIFKTIDGVKSYDTRQQIVYFAPSYTTNNITTVTYTGDYYCDNSSTYTYNIVQEDVNNITGDITDSIVDSTVDQSVTNITNNYYYSSGDGTDSGSGSSDSTENDNPFNGVFEKLMDALGNVVGLLDDLVALLLSFIADALNAIVSMFTNVINMLTEFKDEVSGLTGALGEFFPYLPEDFWTLIMGTVSVICGLAVIKFFKK